MNRFQFSEATTQTILACLAEHPFRLVAPIIQDIQMQLAQQQEEKSRAARKPPPEAAP